MATIIKLKCKICEKNFEVKRGWEKITCSDKCKKELRKKRDKKYYVTKICKNCGNEFISKIKENKKYCSYKCSGEAKKIEAREKRVCKFCGNEFKERKKYKRNFCSNSCRIQWQNLPENKEKRINKSKERILKKYGSDSIFKIKKFQDQIKEKNKLNGKINIKKALIGLEEKRKKELIKRINDLGYKILDFYKNNIIEIKHPDNHIFKIDRKLLFNRLNHNTEISTILLPIYSPKSTLEIKIGEFLKDEEISFETNNRKISKFEADILINNKKLIIELNGLYWHSEYYLNKEYHLEKLNNFNKEGYSLLQFFEDEVIENFDLVKSMIRNKLNIINNKIYARKCEIKEINDNKLVKEFLYKNHLQGFVGSKYKIGLFYNNELVSIMTFGYNRKIMGKNKIEDNFELIRFCNKTNTIVVGGANKLLKYFINKYEPNEIISYANKRYSEGNLYKQLGFTLIGETLPNYWYVINKKREHRFKYRKDVLVKQGYDPLKTEHEIMLERKIPRIYDCGNLKFLYKKTTTN